MRSQASPMQGSFEFHENLPVRPKLPERLFLGVLLDGATALHVDKRAERFVRENHLRGKRLEPERLHISLHHVGDYERLPTKVVYAASQALKAAASMPPFEVTLRSIETF